MKRVTVLLFFVVFFLSMGSMAMAYSHYDCDDTSEWISSSGNGPASNGWFNLALPDWYNGDSNDVLEFDIVLTGDDDNSNSNIDIFLSFNASNDPPDDPSEYEWIAGYNVPTPNAFTLRLDILNNDLLYSGIDVGDLVNISLADFLGHDNFWVGYGCHFTHDQSEVYIAQTPIPGAIWLLGSGLVGLVGFRKKSHC
jgi:hypothetical protein